MNNEKRVFIETYGCSLNASDSELIAGYLSGAGYEIVHNEAACDIVVVNSCTVKGETFANFLKRITRLDAKPVVVAGCVPKVYEGWDFLTDLSYIGTDNISDIVEAVEKTLRGSHMQTTRPSRHKRLNQPKRRRNAAIEILPIARGCLGKCSFCQTRLARGELVSYSIEEITRQARCALGEGVGELWITAQDTGAYGRDIGTNLAELLRELTKIKGDFKIRLGMANPHFVKELLPELIEIYRSRKLFQFIHIPIQSGSDDVLSAMNRQYSVGDFLDICEAFRSEFPKMSISTDIICGYPTETDADFEKTLHLLRRARPSTVNRSRFSGREKTLAAQLEPLPGKVIAERSRELTSVVKEIIGEENKEWIGWKGMTLVDEAKKPGSLLSRNFTYKPIVIEGNIPIGTKLRVKIIGATTFHLKGCPIG